MIIEQIENIARGLPDEYSEFYQNSANNCGVHIKSSGNLVAIINRVRLPNSCRISPSDRGEITQFSASSGARFRRFLRESVSEYSVLITLTYPGQAGYDGKRAKRDLKVFMQRLRRKTDIEFGWSAVWFMEFQSRGAVHFHIFTNRRYEKEAIAKSWYEICGTEDRRHLLAGTRIESIRSGRHGISAYASKYAVKQAQKIIPENYGWSGRFWGVCGDRRTVSADTFVNATAAKSKAVQRKLLKLQEVLEDLIFSGQAKYCDVKRSGFNGYTLIHLNSPSMAAIIRMMIINVEISNFWYCGKTREPIPIKWSHELLGDISDAEDM